MCPCNLTSFAVSNCTMARLLGSLAVRIPQQRNWNFLYETKTFHVYPDMWLSLNHPIPTVDRFKSPIAFYSCHHGCLLGTKACRVGPFLPLYESTGWGMQGSTFIAWAFRSSMPCPTTVKRFQTTCHLEKSTPSPGGTATGGMGRYSSLACLQSP